MRLILSLALLALTLLSTTASAAAQSTPTPAPLTTVKSDLPNLTVEATCYRLTVPENRADPDTRDIDLFVAVLRSPNPESAADPVLFLSGGPGEAASTDLESLAESPLLTGRDLVVLDQRGTGRSEPALTCPEMDAAYRGLFTVTGRALTEEIAVVQDAAADCARRLRAEGVDLDGYDSVETAHDVVDLADALDLDTWNLYGVSYGTRASQAVMRLQPEGLRSVVLDSGAPVDEFETRPLHLVDDLSTGLDHLARACAADQACAAMAPTLRDDLATMVAAFDAAPFRATVPLRTDAHDATVQTDIELTGADLYAVVSILLKEESVIPMLPGLVAALVAGDVDVLEGLIVPLLIDGVLTPGQSFYGAQLSVDCADQAPALSALDDRLLADPREQATVLAFGSGTFCAAWAVDPVNPAFHRPVASDVPTLLVAGAFDPVSLPSQTLRMGAALTDATYVELPASGHVPSMSNGCAATLVTTFITAPTQPLDRACIDEQLLPWTTN